MNRWTLYKVLALLLIVSACAGIFGLVPAGAQDVITEAEFNACMEGWDRFIVLDDEGNPLTRGQLYVLRYRYCVGLDEISVDEPEALEEEAQPPQEAEFVAELIVICKTPDTGGIILPGDMSPESRILSVMVNGQEFHVRAGLSGNELIIRSAQWFPQGTILEIEGQLFNLDPGFRDNTQTWCYRDAA